MNETNGPHLRLSRDGGRATITIDNRAARNALTLGIVDDLARMAGELAADPGVRVLVVTGAGDQAFSAGFDIGAISSTTDVAADGSVSEDRRLDAAFRALEEAPFPVIAQIHGHCIGGGFELALACDLRIGAEDSVFRMPPARLGWVYGLSNLSRFVTAIGPSRAKHVFLTTTTLAAPKAEEWGVLHEVVPKAQLAAHVDELAQNICRLAPIALGGLKHAISALARPVLSEHDTALHRSWRRRAFASADLMEGRAAFLERRSPRFTGT